MPAPQHWWSYANQARQTWSHAVTLLLLHMQVDELLAMDADNEEYRDLQTSLVEVCDDCCKLISHSKGKSIPGDCL